MKGTGFQIQIETSKDIIHLTLENVDKWEI